MRRVLAMGLALCLLLMMMPLGMAEESGMMVRRFSDALERVKLRAEPSTNAKILGKYFGGVPVEVLDVGSKWDKVRVAGRTGYMMKNYLAQQDGQAEGQQGMVSFTEDGGTLPLYADPTASSRVLAQLTRLQYVTVLGCISEEWLHIRWEGAEGTLTGYAAADAITMIDGFFSFRVNTGEAGKRLNLRASASRSAKSLGLYYNGTVMERLFDYDTASGDWARVRVADAVGYMMTAQLDRSAGDAWFALPPLGTVNASCKVYAAYADQTERGYLPAGRVVAVQGSREDRLLVLLRPGRLEGIEYAWVESSKVDVSGNAVSTEAKVVQDGYLETDLSDGLGNDTALPVQAGMKCLVLGWYDPSTGESVFGYVVPEAAWLRVVLDTGSGTSAEGLLPMTSVAMAPGLVLPAGGDY